MTLCTAAVFLHRTKIFLIVPAVLLFFLPGNTSLVFAAGQLQWQTSQTYGGFGTSGPVLIQPDGKVLVAGAKREFPFGSGSGFALTRMLPSGDLDSSFDGDGMAITFFPGGPSSIGALALQPDGKIIAAGVANLSAAFARYNADGSLDATFNGAGKFSLGPQSFVSALAVLPDGKILATGSSGLGSASDFMLIRLNTDGTLDQTFGNGGIGTTPISKRSDQIASMLVQPDGKIVVAGVADFGSPEGNTFIVVRYLPNGEGDPTFDQDSFTITDFGDPNEYATTVALQADGKIVAGGYTSGNSNRAALVRFNRDGSYDNTFGTGGKVVIQPSTLNFSWFNSLAIQSNGKIVAVGSGYNGTTFGALVSRFRRDGSLDTSFDTDGMRILASSPGWRNASASRVAIVPNGSIRVTGNESADKVGSRGFTYSFAGDQQTFVDFDADGRTDISQLNQATADSWGWRRSSDNTGGFVFLPNDQFTHIAPADYTGDGKTDVAQWSNLNGEWTIVDGATLQMQTHIFGVDDDIPAPADFDGDGKADLAVFRPSNGVWYINNSSDGSFSFVQWGAFGDIPVVGDYDADGRSDVAIFRRNAAMGWGEWWIRYSGGGNFVTVFGSSTDFPVVADYTGDGKTDVAFWRPADGYWFILRSDDFNYYAGPFGQAGDYLIPGDYDGDGRSDIAVARGSTGYWYLNQSHDGLLFVQAGGPLARPIPSAYIP